MKSSQIFRTDNILLKTTVCWLSKDVVSFKTEVGIYKKFAKINSNSCELTVTLTTVGKFSIVWVACCACIDVHIPIQ